MSSEFPSPFSLHLRLFGDEQAAGVFSEGALIERWLVVEATLAVIQGDAGVLDLDEVASVVEATRFVEIDRQALWEQSRVVGYPILPLIRMVDEAALGRRGRVHVGATTQDIMDCALAMQAGDAGALLVERIDSVGDELARLTERHAQIVMAARTHVQHAVPTTFGAKCAVYLDEFTRHRDRVRAAAEEVSVVSYLGAGGTSGRASAVVRSHLAQRLGLKEVDVPWDVSRDRISALCSATQLASQMCARLAREIVDLSRTEVGEVTEAPEHHRGDSSTMPQKQNPILSEADHRALRVSGNIDAWHPAGARREPRARSRRVAGSVALDSPVVHPGFARAAEDSRARRTSGRVRQTHERQLEPGWRTPHGRGVHDRTGPASGHTCCARLGLRGRPRRPRRPSRVVNPIRPEDYLGQTERICRVAVERWNFAKHSRTPQSRGEESR